MTCQSVLSRSLVTAIFLSTASVRAEIIRVHPSGGPPHDGSSWTTAYRTLAQALATAAGGDEIWVAAGTYQPGDGTDPTHSFRLQANVAIYGGFTGSETLLAQRNPDPSSNGTVLDGDLLGDDGPDFSQRSDNSHHLVTATGLADPAVLDGFTIRSGNGLAAPSSVSKNGGGILVTTSTVHLANLRLIDNQGDAGGGAFFDRSTVSLRSCSFEANTTWFTSPGGGIGATECDLTLISCDFLLNEADHGGGLYVFGSTLIATQLLFDRNEARYGAGLHARQSGATLTNSRFTRNTAYWNDGGAVQTSYSQVDFVNTLFAGNHAAGTAGAIYIAGISTATDDGSTVRAINCTFFGNEAETSSPGGGAIYCNSDSFLTLQNSILWNNSTAYGSTPLAGKDPEPETSNNLIEGGLPGYPAILDADPRFLDPSGLDGVTGTPDDDLRLALDSPAIGAGDPALLPADTIDLDGDSNLLEPIPLDLGGETREVKLGLELGAYETQELSFHAPDVRLPPDTSGSVVVTEWMRGAQPGDGFTYEIVLRSGPGALSFSTLPVVSETGTLAFTLAPGTTGHATFQITVTDPSGLLPPPPAQSFLVAVGPAVWRVAPGASGSADGSTWSDAIPDLTLAMDLPVPGDQVWVAAGTYRPSSPPAQPSFLIPDAIQVFGGFAGNETGLSQRNSDPLTNGTILDGDLLGDDSGFDNRSDNVWHVVQFDGVGPGTRLDGFTIRGGEAVGLEPADFDQRRGAGILITGSPILCNLHLTANRSTDTGGALYSKQGGPHILDCHFENNESGDHGGAALFYGGSSGDTELLVVEGCLFVDNRSSYGGALDCRRDELLIRSCRFEGNTAEQGGGALHLLSSNAIVQCDFVGNQALSGGALYAYSYAGQACNVRFLGNQANYGGAARLSRGHPRFSNALFSGNSAAVRGGAIYLLDSNLTLLHSTIAGNSARQGGGLWFDSSSSKTMKNCILWGNQAGVSVSEVDAPSAAYLTLAADSGGLLVRGGWPNRSDVRTTDPGFADPLGPDGTTGTDDDDLTPAPDSAACGTALPGVLPADTWDLDADDDTAEELPFDLAGNPRQVDPGVDLGAIEVQSSALHFPDVRLPAAAQGLVVVDSWIANLDPAQAPTFTTALGPTSGSLTFISLPQVTANGTLSFELSPDTSGFAKVHVFADQGGGPESVGSFTLIVSPTVHFVRADAALDGNGISWSNSFQRLSDALAASRSGDEIRVAAGTYYPVSSPSQTATFALKNGVRVRGGYTGSENGSEPTYPTATSTRSVLSGNLLGDNSNWSMVYHVVTAEEVDHTAILESFVVTGGRVNEHSSDGGGGILCRSSSPTLRQLAVLGNYSARYGGGINLYKSQAFIDRCFLGGNSSQYGGGIFSSGGGSVILNSIISGNQAETGGGLCFSNSESGIINSTIVGNTTTRSGGGIFGIGPRGIMISNSILRGNQNSIGTPDNLAGNPIFSADLARCFIQDGYQDLQEPQVSLVDPLMVNPAGPDGIHGTLDDDMRLQQGSPALDAGLDSLLPPGTTTDFANSPRIAGDSVDAGAFEGSVPASFSLLHPGLATDGDKNRNGRTNYEDYALGASPVSPHDPSVPPVLRSHQLRFTYRDNATDVFVQFKKSPDLQTWFPMIEGPDQDYVLESSSSSGGRTTLTLDILPRSSEAPRLFFREVFYESAP